MGRKNEGATKARDHVARAMVCSSSRKKADRAQQVFNVDVMRQMSGSTVGCWLILTDGPQSSVSHFALGRKILVPWALGSKSPNRTKNPSAFCARLGFSKKISRMERENPRTQPSAKKDALGWVVGHTIRIGLRGSVPWSLEQVIPRSNVL